MWFSCLGLWRLARGCRRAYRPRVCLGYPLVLHLACTILVVVTITILAQVLPQPKTPRTYSVTIWLVFYFIPAVYAMLVTVIAAAIVAAKGQQWFWVMGFVAAAGVPFLVAALPYSFLDLNTDYIVRQVGFLGVLVAPEATVLAYSITHPVRPALARQPVSIN